MDKAKNHEQNEYNGIANVNDLKTKNFVTNMIGLFFLTSRGLLFCIYVTMCSSINISLVFFLI